VAGEARIAPTGIEPIFRNEAGRVLATLIRLVGDFELAEEGLQDAFAAAVEQWPVPPKVWAVEEPPPADVEPLLGIWYMEGDQLVFRWRDGTLQAQFSDAPDFFPPAVFERESEQRWRIVSGWEHGELLRVEDGRMVLSGYPVTREPGVWV